MCLLSSTYGVWYLHNITHQSRFEIGWPASQAPLNPYLMYATNELRVPAACLLALVANAPHSLLHHRQSGARNQHCTCSLLGRHGTT